MKMATTLMNIYKNNVIQLLIRNIKHTERCIRVILDAVNVNNQNTIIEQVKCLHTV